MPRGVNRELDSREFQAPPRIEKAIKAAEGPGGVIGQAIETEPIEVVEGPLAMEMADALKFNEDMLTIVIHQSPDRNAEDPVAVGVNGRMCYIWRGQKTMMPRKYVERLLRAQTDSIEQDVTAKDEREFNRLKFRPSQKYPLSILHDPDPRGAVWLQRITENA